MMVAGCQTVAGSADYDGGGYVAGSARGPSAVQVACRVAFVDPEVSMVTSGLDANGAGLAVLSGQVDFDRWAVWSGRARSARAARSVQRLTRLASKSRGEFPM